MNTMQINRCIQRTDRNYHVVADIRHPAGHWVAVKMGGRKVSHRRVKATMKAAKREWPEVNVFFRDGGTLVTPELAADWRQHNASHGYWWPAMAKWAARASRVAARINAEV